MHHTAKPKIYIVGRREGAVNEIVDELKRINGEGEYIFVKGEDLSLMRIVDQVCEVVKKNEKRLDLLWLSAGFLTLEGRKGMEILFLHWSSEEVPCLTSACSLQRRQKGWTPCSRCNITPACASRRISSLYSPARRTRASSRVSRPAGRGRSSRRISL